MNKAAQLEAAKCLAKWKADQYLGLGEEDLDWISNELEAIKQQIEILVKRRAELLSKQDKLQRKTRASFASLMASIPKPKPLRRL